MNKDNLTSKREKRQAIKKLIEAEPYYTLWPKALYGAGLTKHALLVLPYLMGLVNRERSNSCWPSIKTICKNCSIPSATTVRQAIKELKNAGLIKVRPSGRVNIYTLDPIIYLGIDKINKKDNRISKLEEVGTHSDYIESEEKGVLSIEPLYDTTSSPCDVQPRHHVCTNKNKRIKLTKKNKEEKETYKEKENNSTNGNSGVSTDKLLGEAMKKPKSAASGKTNMIAETSKYFQSLSTEGKNTFDIAALKLLGPNESDGTVFRRIARCRYFQELLSVHTTREVNQGLTVPP